MDNHVFPTHTSRIWDGTKWVELFVMKMTYQQATSPDELILDAELMEQEIVVGNERYRVWMVHQELRKIEAEYMDMIQWFGGDQVEVCFTTSDGMPPLSESHPLHVEGILHGMAFIPTYPTIDKAREAARRVLFGSSWRDLPQTNQKARCLCSGLKSYLRLLP
jgi:hypothetical protein